MSIEEETKHWEEESLQPVLDRFPGEGICVGSMRQERPLCRT